MKIFIKYSFFICFLAGAIILLLFMNSDIKNIYFKNFNDTLPYIENGWIPDNLPENSKDIVLTYNLDDNTSNGKFYLENADDITNLKSSLETVNNLSNINLTYLNKDFKNLISSLSSQDNLENVYRYKNFIFINKNISEFYFLNYDK